MVSCLSLRSFFVVVYRFFVSCTQGDDLIHYCKYETMDREKLVRVSTLTKINYMSFFLFVCVYLDVNGTDLHSIKNGTDIHRCNINNVKMIIICVFHLLPNAINNSAIDVMVSTNVQQAALNTSKWIHGRSQDFSKGGGVTLCQS